MYDLNCTTWRKSSRSNSTGACVEVGSAAMHIAVRDSKNPQNGSLTFSPDQWRNFVQKVKHGEFDL